jgi:hypothetical protein
MSDTVAEAGLGLVETSTPAALSPAQQDGEQIQKLNSLLREVEAIANLIADPSLREQALRDITDLGSRPVNPMNINGVIQAAERLREQTRQTVEDASARVVANLSDSAMALSTAGAARVAQRLLALESNDLHGFMASYGTVEIELLPETAKTQIAQAQAAMEASPILQKNFETLRNSPHAKQALEEQEVRKEAAEKLAESPSLSAENKAMAQAIANSPLHLMPQSQTVLDDIAHGEPPEKIRQSMAQLRDELARQAEPHVGALRHRNPLFSHVIERSEHATSPERENMSDADYARSLVNVALRYNEDDYKRATSRWNALGGSEASFASLPEREQEIIASRAQMVTLGGAIAISQAAERARELAALQEKGASLTKEQQASVENFAHIQNKEAPILERAQSLVKAMGSSMPALAQASPQANLALATISLSYIDSHGGMERFVRESGNQTSSYMKDYYQYIGTTLREGGIDITTVQGMADATNALKILGENLSKSPEEAAIIVQTNTKTGELQFLRKGTFSYEAQSSLFTKDENILASYVGYQQVVRDTLRGGANSAQELDARSIAAAYANSYGLYATEEGKKLIDRISRTDLSPEAGQQVLQDVLAVGNKAIQSMTPFAATVLNHLKENSVERYAFLQQQGIIGADGTADLGKLMEGSMRAELKYLRDDKDFRGKSDAEVKAYDAQNPPAAGDISYYEARVIRQTAQEMLAIHSLENVKLLGDAIAKTYAQLDKSTVFNAQTLDDEILYMQVASGHASRTERLEAITTLLARDTYLADQNRKGLLGTTAELALAYLEQNPNYFSATNAKLAGADQPDQATQVPNTFLTFEEGVIPEVVENTASKQTLQEKITDALKGMNTQVLYEALGSAVKAESAQDSKLNEQTLAQTIANAVANVQELDINHDGDVKLDEIRAVLQRPAAQTEPSPTPGR